MEFLAVGGFIAVVAVFVLLGKLKDKAVEATVAAANRSFRGEKVASGFATAKGVFFFNIDAPSDKIIQALKSGITSKRGVPASDAPPTVGFATTYIQWVDEDEIQWAHGTKLQTVFTARASIGTANLDDDTSEPGVMFGFPEYSTLDGMVADLTAMETIRKEVLTSLQSLDPSVTERELEM